MHTQAIAVGCFLYFIVVFILFYVFFIILFLRLPAKLAAELPVGTACNNFLDGGRTLREAVTTTIIIIIIRPPSTKEIGKRRL